MRVVVISLRVQVARSRSKLWKLWTGPPWAVSLLARLRNAPGEGWAGATIEAAPASRGSEIVVVEQHWCQRLTHVPFEMIGEHAKEHVSAHARAEPMEDGTDVEVDGLEAAEGALDAGETSCRRAPYRLH